MNPRFIIHRVLYLTPTSDTEYKKRFLNASHLYYHCPFLRASGPTIMNKTRPVIWKQYFYQNHVQKGFYHAEFFFSSAHSVRDLFACKGKIVTDVVTQKKTHKLIRHKRFTKRCKITTKRHKSTLKMQNDTKRWKKITTKSTKRSNVITEPKYKITTKKQNDHKKTQKSTKKCKTATERCKMTTKRCNLKEM